MLALRKEKQLAESSISLTKTALASHKAEDSFPRGFNRSRLIVHTLV